jgi:hypothetical protein
MFCQHCVSTPKMLGMHGLSQFNEVFRFSQKYNVFSATTSSGLVSRRGDKKAEAKSSSTDSKCKLNTFLQLFAYPMMLTVVKHYIHTATSSSAEWLMNKVELIKTRLRSIVANDLFIAYCIGEEHLRQHYQRRIHDTLFCSTIFCYDQALNSNS